MGRTKADSSIPSSFSADFFQRGKDYAEKLRKGEFVFFVFDFGITEHMGRNICLPMIYCLWHNLSL